MHLLGMYNDTMAFDTLELKHTLNTLKNYMHLRTDSLPAKVTKNLALKQIIHRTGLKAMLFLRNY